jgi:hypothetical protein
MKLKIREVIHIHPYTIYNVSCKENRFPINQDEIGSLLHLEVEMEDKKYRIGRIEVKPIPGDDKIDDIVGLHLLEVERHTSEK